MNSLPNISGHECLAALQKVGFNFVKHRGSHLVVFREDPPTQLVIPYHEELDRATLWTIIKQAGLSIDEFLWLLSATTPAQTPVAPVPAAVPRGPGG